MKKEFSVYSLLWLLLIVSSCSGSRGIPEKAVLSEQNIEAIIVEPDSVSEVQNNDLNEADDEPVLKILYDDRRLFSEPQSNFDVLSTSLDVSFDFPRQQVIGIASHRLRVTSESLDKIILNGRDMDIKEVSARIGDAAFLPHNFQYQNNILSISLFNSAQKGDQVEVLISYVASPRRSNDNLGLVFVDPLEIDASRPTQIWTLGQPEDNQYWFPAWDYPNDRMTFELTLTVPSKFMTVANGQLVHQELLAGSMRKDHWVLDKPHPSYLTGFAVGEFAAVADSYTRSDGSVVPLAYFVEPEHKNNASLVFGETPDIMGFFERKLGIAYPWENYKQVCVRDFTARGMENTTATIMYDKLQHDEQAHLDETGLDLIVHELAHQWFGNLMTCRNWAHLPLNEGFASYSERLYLEEASGIGAAQMHTIEDRNAYFKEANSLLRPVIWFNYEDPNQLYDRHTYQKAALILHQMRNELGENVWWQGVRKYTRDNAFQQVVLEDLQRAMEDAAGKPLGGFFDQWYRRPGHPVLHVTHTYDQARGLYGVRVVQTQDSVAIGNFSFDVDIEVNMQGFSPFTQRYRVATRDTMFHFAIAGAFSFVRFNAGDWLLADINVEKEPVEWMNQLRLDDEMAGRLDAAYALGTFEKDDRIRDELMGVLSSDRSPYVRNAVAEVLESYVDQEAVRLELLRSVREDSDASVRKSALLTLSLSDSEQLKAALERALEDDSYQVIASAVDIYTNVYPDQFARAVRPLFGISSWQNTVELALINGYSAVKSLEGIPYIQQYLSAEYNENVQVAAVRALASIAEAHAEVRNSILELFQISIESIHEPVRYEVAVGMQPLRGEKVREIANAKINNEQSERVRSVLQQLIVP